MLRLRAPDWLRRLPDLGNKNASLIVPPYMDVQNPRRRLVKILFPVFLGFACLLYGFFFALTAPYLIVPLAAPIALLMLMSIWALPDRAQAPTKSMEFFFSALIVTLILWPNYLALALPGLPWITMLRLTGFPMALLFLISLSTSVGFRSELSKQLDTVNGLKQVFVVFIAIQFISLALSKSPADALQKTLLQQINWTMMAVVGMWVCLAPGRATRYISLIVLISLPIMGLVFMETTQKQVLWSGHVPGFLKVDDPVAAIILSAAIRGATGLYRVKTTFSTPLGLAEYLALLTPFLIHFAVSKNPIFIRIASVIILPILFYCIRQTDARLGNVGYLVSFLLYFLYWGLRRFQRNRRDLFAATVVYGYPLVFIAFAIAVSTIRRVNILVFGDGAQAASNQARENQLHMGIPKILVNPVGHGAGGSGPAMGYGSGEFVTIDNYYLSLGLDYGVVGLTCFVMIFVLGIAAGTRASLATANHPDKELSLVVPLTIALTAFLIIKLVFSQQDNHPLVFAMLGMTVALVSRVKSAASVSLADPGSGSSLAQAATRPRLNKGRARLRAPREPAVVDA